MANFREAFDLVDDIEGDWNNDPDDQGGETYRGIARRYSSDWPGWQIIDGKKPQYMQDGVIKVDEFNTALKRDSQLNKLVVQFFKKKFWNSWHGDEITNQDLANEIYEASVHLGLQRTIRYIQAALNVLNRNQSLWKDLKEDGLCGPKTLNVLKKLLESNVSALIILINCQQGVAYLKAAQRSKVKEKYMYGWIERRVQLYGIGPMQKQ